MKKEICLSPKWFLNQEIKYKIYRKDHFSYSGTQRFPIENSYDLHLRILTLKKNKIEIEAHYPFGFLYLLTSFQPFSSLIGKEEMFLFPEGNKFHYLINKDGVIRKIKGLNNIKKVFKLIQSNIRNSSLKKKEKKRILGDLHYLSKSKKAIREYLSRDIELIHRLYGNRMPLTYFYDNSSEHSEDAFEEGINKLKGKEYIFFKHLADNYQELDFVNTFLNKKEFVVDEVSGLNLLSVDIEDRHDLSEIRKDYLNKNFNIEAYTNITLHQEISKFDLKRKHLNFYSHVMRIVSEKMQKITEVKIKMVKRK